MDSASLQNEIRTLLRRLGIALVAFLAISSISIHVAWKNTQTDSAVWREHYQTQHKLGEVRHESEEYHKKFNKYPVSLEQLTSTTNVDELAYWRLDGWKRPFLFSVGTTNFIITSLGRDGKVGGVGLDYDLTSQDLRPKEALPTLEQFLSNERCRAMILCCIGAGVITSLFFLEYIPKLEKRHVPWPSVAWRLLMIVAGAIIMALTISGLHIPNGH